MNVSGIQLSQSKKKVKVNISKEKESITSEFKVVKGGQVSFSYPPKIG